MRAPTRRPLLPGVAAFLLSAPLLAQAPTDVEITGHILEPQRLAPTEARISGLQLFALDTRLELPDGFNRHALLEAMQGHVLAEGEFIGTFQKAE